MNIQLLSDLHLESHPGFVPEPAPGWLRGTKTGLPGMKRFMWREMARA